METRDIYDCFRLYKREDEYLTKWKLTDKELITKIANKRVQRLCGLLAVWVKAKRRKGYTDYIKMAREINQSPVFLTATHKCNRTDIAAIYRIDIFLMKYHCWPGIYFLHRYII